jgi:hypothetical protein
MKLEKIGGEVTRAFTTFAAVPDDQRVIPPGRGRGNEYFL